MLLAGHSALLDAEMGITRSTSLVVTNLMNKYMRPSPQFSIVCHPLEKKVDIT